ncbi:unnamed protein product [Orchesella dallaii]|uniref:BTB domain-containing protein n=1 Tax=Orchesella dallaii TaxID=48710 RepID=A0ABP1RPD5_9HEXA
MKVTVLDMNQVFIQKGTNVLQNHEFAYVLAQYPLELGVESLKPNEGTESMRNFRSEIRNHLVVSPSLAPVGSDLSKKPTIGFMFEGNLLSIPPSPHVPPVQKALFDIYINFTFSTAAFIWLWKHYNDHFNIIVEMGFENDQKIQFKGFKPHLFLQTGVIPKYGATTNFHGPAQLFASKPEVRVSLKVEVELEDPLNWSPVRDHRVLNKNILLKQIQCDFKIIAKDDQVLQCHKAFLAAQSKVFTTMFNTACEETTNNQVKLPISHAGVDAFLKFLYYSDVEAALGSPTLAMDLLELGHKYDISPLQSKMKKILSGRKNWWYSADNALRLFEWSCKVTEHKDLKKKAVDVIRSKVQQLKGLNRFQQMFPNSIGAELFIASLQSSLSLVC